MATLYPLDENTRTITPANGKTFTLEELQTAVGGPVQLIRFSSTQVLFVHEEGQMRQLPINEKVTESIGQDRLQACLGVAHLVGNVLLCTNTEAGLSEAKRTRAQRVIAALRSWCSSVTDHLGHDRNQRDYWQMLGRYGLISDVADRLSVVTPTTGASKVHVVIESLLDRLASTTIRDGEIDRDLQGRYTNRSRFQYRIEG